VKLLPVRHEDEDAAVTAHLDPGWLPFSFLYGYDPSMSWAAYVFWLADVRRGVSLRQGEVPATFLLAWVDGKLVGRSSIRHKLNHRLESYDGHIGYGVVPAFRRRGYATEILRQSLVVARTEGIVDVLVTCDEHNMGSALAIERCGGALDSIVERPAGGPRKRRYWIY
jgi:predicted acetyltransferase